MTDGFFVSTPGNETARVFKIEKSYTNQLFEITVNSNYLPNKSRPSKCYFSLEIQNLIDNPFSTSEYKQKNIFAERFKLKLESKNTEASFSDQDFGIRGIIDLIINQSTIVDYKTSSYVKKPKE